jgi:outer membrane receptor for ferrienterochelin and colicins
MQRLLFFFTFSCISFCLSAQNIALIKVVDAATKKGLTAVTISKKNKAVALTDSLGNATITLPIGTHLLSLTTVGYQDVVFKITVPNTSTTEILLTANQKSLDEVVVISSTRNNQRIENSPLKVEVLGKEEMNEENAIKPGNIASILGDVSGIQIQQSSAINGNSNVRIQGLDGRYTQILRDGMPLFDGFSGGFGIMQIPPLDLKQIELIKGSASTLYGGGAIGGLINLISKKPQYNQEAIFTINHTTLKENNVNVWASKRYKKIGYTFFAGLTNQLAADVNKDGFSDVAKNEAWVVHPKIFFYPTKATSIAVSYTGTFENRIGGDMQAIKHLSDTLHQFFEANNTKRQTFETIVESDLGNKQKLAFKASVSTFKRGITTNTNYFNAKQINFFNEISLLIPTQKISWVMGVNAIGEHFKKLPSSPALINTYTYKTIGAFIQSTINVYANTILESGIRFDHHSVFGNFLLPRVAVFHRFNEQWATRGGIGFGYKIPNPLSVQNTDYSIEKIQPLGPNIIAEKSIGYNAEFNYKKTWSENKIFINQAFFLTQINNPMIATVVANNEISFSNAIKPIITKGIDTYIQLTLNDWEIYCGYTYTIAERKYLTQHQFVPLTPKDRFAFTLVKEIENKWRFGIEGSYTGTQIKDDNTKTKGYFFCAAMVERKFGKKCSVVLNGENLFDYRQSKYETLYTGTITQPTFKPLWAPIDGIIINASITIKPFAK